MEQQLPWSLISFIIECAFMFIMMYLSYLCGHYDGWKKRDEKAKKERRMLRKERRQYR